LALGGGFGKGLEPFLFKVRPEDTLTFSAVLLFFFAISLIAYFVPALRASRVDPVDALNTEGEKPSS
jgi:ABC-type lipoprotein release transport system permease subunit